WYRVVCVDHIELHFTRKVFQQARHRPVRTKAPCPLEHLLRRRGVPWVYHTGISRPTNTWDARQILAPSSPFVSHATQIWQLFPYARMRKDPHWYDNRIFTVRLEA